MSAKVRN